MQPKVALVLGSGSGFFKALNPSHRHGGPHSVFVRALVTRQQAFGGAMGLQGYVGGAEDVQRIRRQEKKREEEKKKFEEQKKRSDANVDAAGIKQFGAGKMEARSA